MNFGEFIRQKRLESNKSLRTFSKEAKLDLAYISRLETEILLPPEEKKKLKKIAKAYGFIKNSEEWHNFMDLAAISRKQIPGDLDSKVINYLPAFFRKASKKKVTQSDVDELLKLIKGD